MGNGPRKPCKGTWQRAHAKGRTMAHLTESAIESAAFSWLAEGTQHYTEARYGRRKDWQ